MATDLQIEEHVEHETTTGVRRLRISRTMYMGMLEAGVITGDQRIQLVDGQIYEFSPMDTPHWIALGRLRDLIGRRMLAGWSIVSRGGDRDGRIWGARTRCGNFPRFRHDNDGQGNR